RHVGSESTGRASVVLQSSLRRGTRAWLPLALHATRAGPGTHRHLQPLVLRRSAGVRIHPQVLANEKLPPSLVTKHIWQERFDDINNFERYLTRNGIAVVKFFLNLSKKEQKRRFMERLDTPDKNWKFSSADVKERQF